MSLDKVRKVFMQSSTCPSWSLQLLRIKNTKREGTTYSGRESFLSPDGALASFVDEISKRYISGPKAVLDSYFNSVTEYNGTTLDKTIYKLSVSNELIATEYDSLITAIADPDKEINPLEFKAQAYLLIVDQLDELVEQGQLSAYYRKVILEMSTKVVEHLAARYETVKEGVRSVMGGKVLEYEAKTIYREGMQVGMREGKQEGLREGKQKGLREGKLEGRADATLESIRSLMETLTLTAEQAMEALKVPRDEQEKYRAML